MKVALLTKHFNFRNGSSRAVHETAERVIREGHEAHVFCNRYPRNYRGGAVIRPVPILRLGAWAKVLSFNANCARRVGRGNFDVVHGQGNTIDQDILTVHVCRKANRLARGLPVSALDPHYYLERKQFESPRLHTVIALSERVKADLVRFYTVPPERIRVIPNGVDAKRFHPGLRERFRSRMRREWSLSDSEIGVLFVASGNFQNRGLPNLLRAFRDLSDDRFRLIIAGGDRSGVFRRMVREMGLAKKVRFLPFAGNIEEVYAGGDVLAFPSYYDTFGNVPLEAMASGLPVIVTAACGVSEWIQNARNGMVLKDPADVSALTGILSSLSDRGVRTELGRNASASARDLGWDKITARVTEVYSDFLSGRTA